MIRPLNYKTNEKNKEKRNALLFYKDKRNFSNFKGVDGKFSKFVQKN